MKKKSTRIAVPIFGTRVSPRFDFAPRALVIEIREGKEASRCELPLEIGPTSGRISFLLEKGVEVLLCGGIRRCDYFAFKSAGITVFPCLIGEVEVLLTWFLEGDLPNHEDVLLSQSWRARRGPGPGCSRKRGEGAADGTSASQTPPTPCYESCRIEPDTDPDTEES